MKLYEFEGHKILRKAGIENLFFITCANQNEVKQAIKRLKFPVCAKIQILSGGRGKAGGVKFFTRQDQLMLWAKNIFGSQFLGEEVRFITVGEKIKIASEYYVSITYDPVQKTPFLIFSEQGGVDIEEVEKKNPDAITRIDIDPFKGPLFRGSTPKKARSDSLNIEGIDDFCMRLWDAFCQNDCRLVEVNPLAKLADGSLVAVDAKIILDDAGLIRHRDLDLIPKGAISTQPTNRELEAKKIDEDDYRGSAGSTFIDLAGDIAILASGGGASLLVMDSVVASGGKPANYTEYSGNPPREKVAKLTEITLARENLAGCLVCGAVANFTDIYETLAGFLGGLSKITPKPRYPIVIRRGGPRQKEAYAMIEKFAQKEGFDIHLFGPETPISTACKKMVELSNKFKIDGHIN